MNPKSVARAVVESAAAAITTEVPSATAELVMEELNPRGGLRMHRITDGESQVYVITAAHYLTPDEAARMLPKTNHEGASEVDHTNPVITTTFPQINVQGPVQDPPIQRLMRPETD